MKDKDHWVQNSWRPMMGWTYMITCLFDFIIGPVYYNLLQYWNPGQHIDMWQAITLQGGGLYHLAMGAILGISAYGRTQEKISPSTNSQYMLPNQRYSQPNTNYYYNQPNNDYNQPNNDYNQSYAPAQSTYNHQFNDINEPVNEKPIRRKHTAKPIPPADTLL